MEGNHCVVHDSCRYSSSDRNAPLHCLADSASDSADCGADAAAGYVTGTAEASGMDAQIVVDGDLCGVVDAGLVMDVVDLSEMDVDVDSCDVGGLLTADVGNDEWLDLMTALNQGQLVVKLMWGYGGH